MHRIAIAWVLLVGCDEKPAAPPSSGSASSAAPVAVEQPKAPPPAVNTDVKGPEAPAFAVRGIEPDTGDAEGGTYVVIKGAGFTTTARSAKVFFGDKQGQVVRFQSDRELIVMAPGGEAGTRVDVRVAFEPGGELKLKAAFEFVRKEP